MPFLDRLSRWAEQRPQDTAVVCADDRLSWSGLRSRAAELAASGEAVGILQQGTGTEFVVRWAAGVAERRVCAVLDPALPESIGGAVGERCRDVLPESAAPAHLRDGPDDSAFLVGLTSGTTSVPKGFLRSRGSWRRSFEASTRHFDLRSEDRVLVPGPLSSSMNLYALSECLHAGAAAVVLPRFDSAAARAAITAEGVTRVVAVPTMLRLIAERALAAGESAHGLRAIVCAGQKLDPQTLAAARRWAPNAVIWEYFGAAELGFVAAQEHPPGEIRTLDPTAVGLPFPGVEAVVVDHDGRVLPEGSTGSIAVRSDLVCDGYLWGDDGRAFARIADLATVRDQGFLRDGRLHVLGRASEMINTGGLNIYPQEVEAAIGSVPGVAEAVVVGLPDPSRGQRLVAGVLLEDEGADRQSLRAALETMLASTKRPQQYWRLGELPVTGGGKISRAVLRSWIEEGDPRARPLG